MSITIVSTLPKPMQAADNAGRTSADSDKTVGQDFASLLQGQLAPVVPSLLPDTTIPAKSPESDAAPGDAALLIAALGIVQPETGRNSDSNQVMDTSLPTHGKLDKTTSDVIDTSLPTHGKPDKTTSDALTTLQTRANLGQSLQADSKGETVKAETVLAGTVVTDDKAAKFAVAALSAANSAPVAERNPAADLLPNTTPALSTNAPINTNNSLIKQDVALSIPATIRDQNWAADFSQRIVWLATSNKQSAQLTLNPPQMGPIEVSLNLDKGSATASFVSANAAVRDAIETALPRLREMFASAGIELGQTNVSAESFKQQAGSGEGNGRPSQWTEDNAILVTGSDRSLSGRAFAGQQGNGLVDIFA